MKPQNLVQIPCMSHPAAVGSVFSWSSNEKPETENGRFKIIA